jgi:Fur family transcriptional regulator, peroxide stress response regulator
MPTRLVASRGTGRGSRATRQLEATLQVLSAAQSHPTAEQIFRAVRAAVPSISLATVYRNLGKLTAEGRARIVPLADGPARFDGRTDRHDHFVCSACGRVVDVEASPTAPHGGRSHVGRHRVEDVALTYFGSCAGCLRRPSTPGREV